MNRVELNAVHGDGHLERIDVRDIDSSEVRSFDAAALFIFIGTAPRSQAFTGTVEADGKGFILTGADVKLTGFVRMQIGEGLDKKEDDFAAEVAKMSGQ